MPPSQSDPRGGGNLPMGHLFHLIVWKQGTEFYLHLPDQLMELFSFLDRPAVSLPNWFDYLLSQETSGPGLPRPRRIRRPRSRASSREAPRSMPNTPEA